MLIVHKFYGQIGHLRFLILRQRVAMRVKNWLSLRIVL